MNHLKSRITRVSTRALPSKRQCSAFSTVKETSHCEKGPVFLMSAPMNINKIPDTVAFKNIDKKGGSKRFYREVFLSETEDSEFTIYLDNRILLAKGNRPVTIPNRHVALTVASEFEAQATYIRLDSMPLTDLEVKRNIMEGNHMRIQRRKGIIETLEHTLSEDLICIAESKERREDGFYEEYWQPIIDWFNGKFGSNFKIVYANMGSQDDNQSFFEQLVRKEPHEMITEFESFMAALKRDPASSSNYEKIVSPQVELGSFRRWTRLQPDLKLMVLDELIGYFPSVMLGAALVEHAFELDFLLKAVNCSELDTHVLSLYKENLKLTETQLFLAAGKCYLNLYEIDSDSRVLVKEEMDGGVAYRKNLGPLRKLHKDADEEFAKNWGSTVKHEEVYDQQPVPGYPRSKFIEGFLPKH